MKRMISNETNLSMDQHPFRNRIENIDAHIEKNLSKNKMKMNNTMLKTGTKFVDMYQSVEGGLANLSMRGSIVSNKKMDKNIK